MILLSQPVPSLRLLNASVVMALVPSTRWSPMASTPGSIERIEASPLERLFITDTIETQPVSLSAKIELVSIAPLLAEAIRRIHTRESVSGMFSSPPL